MSSFPLGHDSGDWAKRLEQESRTNAASKTVFTAHLPVKMHNQASLRARTKAAARVTALPFCGPVQLPATIGQDF